jgi:ketosteroid isomerase-like protein
VTEAVGHLLDPGFMCVWHFPGAAPETYPGQDGLRAAWRDWLAPWASYRSEIEELIDVEEHVVAVVRDYGRREPDAPEVGLQAAAVWTVRDGRVVRAEFYPSGRAEALVSVGLAE